VAPLASLVLLWIQGPGDGSAFLQSPPREVQRAYWDLLQTTEVWVTTLPEGPQGKPLVNLVFHASFPGRAKRDVHSGLPQWPKGQPARLMVRAQPLPLTLVPELSLRILIDGDTIDFSGPDGRCGHPPCRDAIFNYDLNTVEAEIDPLPGPVVDRGAKRPGGSPGSAFRARRGRPACPGGVHRTD